MLVFEDACLNGVQSLWECLRGQFWVHYFFLYIYVSNLPTVVGHSQMNMYANDTELHFSRNDLLSVQRDFLCDHDAIHAWLCVNRLQLNVPKSSVIIATRQKINYHNVTVHISG